MQKYAYSTQKAMNECLLTHPIRKNPDLISGNYAPHFDAN
jgi:hypothetical protein